MHAAFASTTPEHPELSWAARCSTTRARRRLDKLPGEWTNDRRSSTSSGAGCRRRPTEPRVFFGGLDHTTAEAVVGWAGGNGGGLGSDTQSILAGLRRMFISRVALEPPRAPRRDGVARRLTTRLLDHVCSVRFDALIVRGHEASRVEVRASIRRITPKRLPAVRRGQICQARGTPTRALEPRQIGQLRYSCTLIRYLRQYRYPV
jgi:hypothetical protein